MYMKINELSSNQRMTTKRGRAGATTALFFSRGHFNPYGGQLSRRKLGVAPLPVGGVEGKKTAGGNPSTPKDVKNEGRSGNVYENKGPYDISPDRKGDICAWLYAI